jgi:hypothetical protein
LGVYPQYPRRAELLLIAPLFTKVIVHRSNDVVITINATLTCKLCTYSAASIACGSSSNSAMIISCSC